LWTNDIHQTEEFFGIEAAIQMINNELQRALSVDSYVDPRHTLLLSETMSRCGSIIALNRNNMENLGASTLACAAFERTLPVLEEAAFYGLRDPLRGSLERQILGLPLRVGTGIVGIVTDQQKHQRPVVLAPLKRIEHKSENKLAPLLKESLDRSDTTVAGLTKLSSESGWSPYVSSIPDFLSSQCQLFSEVSQKWIHTLQQEYHSCTLRLELLNCTSPNIYKDLQLLLDSYLGWDNPNEFLEWDTSVEVQWAQELEKTCTISKLKNSSQTGKASKVHLQKLCTNKTIMPWPIGNVALEAKLMHYKTIANDLVPDSVTPTLVVLRHKKEYVKDGWVYTLTRRWKATSAMECESKQYTEEPEKSFSISTSSLQVLHTFPSLHLHQAFVAKMHACL
jgi:hypothetical protein